MPEGYESSKGDEDEEKATETTPAFKPVRLGTVDSVLRQPARTDDSFSGSPKWVSTGAEVSLFLSFFFLFCLFHSLHR